MNELYDLLDHARLVHHERNLVHDDRGAAVLHLFELGPRSYDDAATTRFVRLLDAAPATDEAAGREIGALHDLHEIERCRVRIVDDVHARIHDFGQVVRRNVRRHTDGDAAAAVDEKIRKLGRKDGRLLQAIVEV